MEYLDFSSVITLIRKYINDERTVMDKLLKEEVKIDQIHLLDQLFASFCDDADSLDYAFDNGQVCRWFNGQARISPRIISYYMDEENRELLSADIEYNVLPLMYDSAMATQDVHTLLLQDTTISHEIKKCLRHFNAPAPQSEGTEKHTIFILTSIKKKKSIRVFMILVDFWLGEI